MAGAAACALLALAGCGSGTVEVDPVKVPADQRAACRAIVDGLPGQVGNQPSQETSGNEYAAAWGDPPIVLRCGVGLPQGYDRASPCQRANDIDWYVPESAIDDTAKDVVMTTIGRTPALEVTVPARYRPNSPANVMIDLEGVVAAHTERTGSCE